MAAELQRRAGAGGGGTGGAGRTGFLARDARVRSRHGRAPRRTATDLVELADGGEFELEIVLVKKQIGDATVRMLAYNGSVPGPTLKVPQGGTITVHVTNRGDLDATVHWHGLRLENRFDGTHETQAPIPVGALHLTRCTPPTPAPTEPRTNADGLELRERIQLFLAKAPDKALLFVAEMNLATPEGDVTY